MSWVKPNFKFQILKLVKALLNVQRSLRENIFNKLFAKEEKKEKWIFCQNENFLV